MASGQWGVVLRHVHRLFQGGSLSGLSEGQLLDRFASDRDELAFGALLARHGPMVLGVCRGVLDDPNDVDDAFQATFLVLVKKAGALRDGDRLAQWLYGVARKVALRARSDANRRKSRERAEAEEAVDPRATLDSDLRELQSLIREEVDRLTPHDRMAVVLCYLEGLTHEEAADRLGWPVGTVKGRLSRAREKLRLRLNRRGVTLPAVPIASGLAEAARSTVPLALIRSTTSAAVQVAAGQTLTAGVVSAHAITLMEGVLGTMITTKLKIAATALVAAGFVAVPGVLAYQQGGSPGPATKTQIVTKASQPPAEKGPPGVAGAIRPGGSIKEEVDLARQAMDQARKLTLADDKAAYQLEKIPIWSRRLLEAQMMPGTSEPDRKSALQAHRDRMNEHVKLVTDLIKSDAYKPLDLMEARFHLLEADRWVRDGQITSTAERPAAGDGIGTGFGGDDRRPLVLKTMPGDEKRNQAILAKLEEPLSMNFASDTPLADVIKYIRDATQDEAAGLANGIPIYVDPQALADNDTTMASTVKIHLEGIPLRTTLRLLLHQMKLDYRVEAGLLLITDEPTLIEELRANGGGMPGNRAGMGGMGGGFR